jgi:hypothetical protein
MRRISRSGLGDVCCGAGVANNMTRARAKSARAAFETKRKHIQTKMNMAGLLNPPWSVPPMAPGRIPLCIRHCRFSPEKLIERPIATSLLPAPP